MKIMTKDDKVDKDCKDDKKVYDTIKKNKFIWSHIWVIWWMTNLISHNHVITIFFFDPHLIISNFEIKVYKLFVLA